jgi:hypothetical protein
MLRAVVIAVLVLAGAVPLAAQVVRGTVVSVDSTASGGVIVVGIDDGGVAVTRALTGSRGEFTLQLPAPGRYSIRMLRIGSRPNDGPTLTLAAGETKTIRMVFAAQPVVLSTLDIRARQTCRVDADTGLMVVRVWDEARKAMLSSQLSADGAAPLLAEWVEFDRILDSTARFVREQRVRASSHATTHAFRSPPAGVLTARGYVVSDGGEVTFFAPDAEVLLSEEFAAAHCFRLAQAPPGRDDLIGVRFEPTRERQELRDRRDIEGELWLDRASAELRSLDFRYTNLPDAAASAEAGGEVHFLRLDDGNWIVTRWSVRMPRLEMQASRTNQASGRVVRPTPQALLRGVQVTGGEVTRLTRRDTLVYELFGQHIALQLIARDTLVRASRAIVTLDGTDYAASADVSGSIVLSPVLAGRYRARVRTPLMDSLGMPAIEREVDARADARIDTLMLPAARTVVELRVFDAQGQPLRDVLLEARMANGQPRRWTSGSDGRVLLRDIGPGGLSIRARRIGFQPGSVEVPIQAGWNAVPIVLSNLAAPTLDTMRVVAARQVVPRLQDFETRRLRRQATVSITREDILRRNPTETWQMLTGVPSIEVFDMDTVVIAASTRSRHLKPDLSFEPCYMLVLVDGIVMNRNPSSKALDLRDLPRPEEIHGIEVFAGPASIPAQYGGTGDGKWCGMIAIWTR